MQYSNLLLALTALSTSVSGLALPTDTVPGTQTCQFTELKSNQSTAFGWQIAGAALDAAEKDGICHNFVSTVLANAGLDVQKIKLPSCSASKTPVTAQDALPNAVRHSSDAFLTMLTNALAENNEPGYHYLCDNIRFVQLRSFMLDDATIVNATCTRGGPDAFISPEPFTSSAEPNMTAVAAYKELSSKLFAAVYAATASNKEKLTNYCNRAEDYKENLEALQLDPATVEWEICSLRAVPKVAETRAAIKELTSQQFLTVVQNMSNVDGWNEWLCKQLDQNAMNGLGLDGAKIKAQVCGK